jgi:hypothetical protein
MSEEPISPRELELMETIVTRARAVSDRPGDPELQRKLEWGLRALDAYRFNKPKSKANKPFAVARSASLSATIGGTK